MAPKYRKVDPRIWSDEKFSRLDCEGKLLAIWLLTSSRLNRVGIILWSPGLASEETGIKPGRIDTVFDTVSDTLGWVVDKASKVVFLPRWWHYNCPDNISALKGAMSDLKDVPQNSLKSYLQKSSEFIPTPMRQVYLDLLDTVYDRVSYTVSPQEQEQKQEQYKAADKPPKEKKQNRPRNELFDVIVELTGLDANTAAGHIAKVAALLSKSEPPYTPDEVRKLPALVHLKWPDMAITPGVIEKYIGWVRSNPEKNGLFSHDDTSAKLAETARRNRETFGET